MNLETFTQDSRDGPISYSPGTLSSKPDWLWHVCKTNLLTTYEAKHSQATGGQLFDQMHRWAS